MNKKPQMTETLLQISSSLFNVIKSPSITNIELLEASLKSPIEYFSSTLLLEILQNLDQCFVYNINKEIIKTFLIKLIYEKTNIDNCVKLYAYTLMEKITSKIDIKILPYVSKIIQEKIIIKNIENIDIYKKKYFVIFRKLKVYNNIEFIVKYLELFINSYNSTYNFQISLEYFEFILQYYDSKLLEILKKTFNFFLDIILNKKNKSRFIIAKFLIKINLKSVIFNKEKILKICKKFLYDKNTIYELAIKLMKEIDIDISQELKNVQDLKKIKIIFRYVKNQNELVYKKYLELKNYPFSREVTIDINDIKTFSKVFYTFHNKNVIKFIYIDMSNITEITNLYILDLLVYYSKYHANSINKNFISSLLFSSDNILFTRKLIMILINIKYYNIKIFEYLKSLIKTPSYTKIIGKYFYESKNIKIFDEDDIVVLASLNHQKFFKKFENVPWDKYKERALIYNLEFNPELGLTYSKNLEKILTNDDYLNILEFLNFLIFFLDMEYEDNVYNFYMKFIIKNKHKIYDFVKLKNESIRISAFKLIIKCTDSKILIKEESIPFMVLHYKYDDSLFLYREILKNNIIDLIRNRIKIYKNERMLYDKYFIKNINTNVKFYNIFDSIEDQYELLLAHYILYINIGEEILKIDMFDEDFYNILKHQPDEDIFYKIELYLNT